MTVRAHQAGFTLLEVLVSLAILALVLIALIHGAGQNIANQSYLEERTFAHWVAMNRLAELQLQERTPPIGRSENSMTLGGRNWRWTMEIQKTPDEHVLRVDLAVAREEKASSLAQLTGYTAVRQ